MESVQIRFDTDNIGLDAGARALPGGAGERSGCREHRAFEVCVRIGIEVYVIGANCLNTHLPVFSRRGLATRREDCSWQTKKAGTRIPV